MKLMTAILTGLVFFSGNLFAVEGFNVFKFGDSYSATVKKAQPLCPAGLKLGESHSYFPTSKFTRSFRCSPGPKIFGQERTLFFFFGRVPNQVPHKKIGPLEGVVVDFGKHSDTVHQKIMVALISKYGQERSPPRAEYRNFQKKRISYWPSFYDNGTLSLLSIWYADGKHSEVAYHRKRPPSIPLTAAIQGQPSSPGRGSNSGKGKRFTVPDSAVVRGGPNKKFLGTELYVTPGTGIAPGPGGFSVHQIVDALGSAKKKWKPIGKGQWMVTVTKADPMTRRYMTVKILFARYQDKTGKGAMMKRVTMNNQKLSQGQIFQFAQQLALKAEAKN